jgi:hypothetical protein
MLSKLREFPEGLTAEDTMRRLVGDRQSFSAAAVRSTLARLIKVLDEDSDITVSETIRIQWQLHVPSFDKGRGCLATRRVQQWQQALSSRRSVYGKRKEGRDGSRLVSPAAFGDGDINCLRSTPSSSLDGRR